MKNTSKTLVNKLKKRNWRRGKTGGIWSKMKEKEAENDEKSQGRHKKVTEHGTWEETCVFHSLPSSAFSLSFFAEKPLWEKVRIHHAQWHTYNTGPASVWMQHTIIYDEHRERSWVGDMLLQLLINIFVVPREKGSYSQINTNVKTNKEEIHRPWKKMFEINKNQDQSALQELSLAWSRFLGTHIQWNGV